MKRLTWYVICFLLLPCLAWGQGYYVPGAASATAKGTVELATDAETVTGTDTARATTPANITAKMAAPGAIGGTTANTIRYLMDEDVEAATDTLTANQCSGGLINNYGQAADAVLTLPAAAAGMNFIVILGTTVAKYYRLDPNASDKIYLDGTADSDGHYCGIASAAAGACIVFTAFQTGASAYDWYASTVSGLWVME